MKNKFRVTNVLAQVTFHMPKLFFIKSSKYYFMSLQAKYAYSLLNEYLKESLIEKQVDEKNHVYISYTNQELAILLNVSEEEIEEIKDELEDYDLLTGELGRIYLKELTATMEDVRVYQNQNSFLINGQDEV
uniref:replication initiator protein A n=1 Tax=Enterococcus faecalis TaxID=1351 RepID=UPI00359C3D76